MEENAPKGPEELAQEIDNFEVTELDDKDLEGAAGGNYDEEIQLPGDGEAANTNCGCGGHRFSGVQGSSNSNCGCP